MSTPGGRANRAKEGALGLLGRLMAKLGRPGFVPAVARHTILRGSVAVIVAQGATAASGYVFWLLAAHRYPVHVIGSAATVTSLAVVVAMVAGQAIVASLLVRLPRSDHGRALLWTAVSLSTTASLGLGIVCILVLPLFVPGVGPIRAPLFGGATALMCVSQTAGLVADGAALALKRWRLVAGRNALFGLGKLALAGALMNLVHANGAAVLVGSWALIGTVTAAVSLAMLHRQTHGSGWAFGTVTKGLGYQTIASICGYVPPQLFPAIVAAQAGTVMTGYFSLTWSLGGIFSSVSPAVCQAMLPTKTEDLRRSTRHAALIIGGLLVIPVVVFIVAGRELLSIFGTGYGIYGAGLLALLAISSVPDSITNLAVARWRIQERLRPAAVLNGLIGIVAIGLALGPMRASHHDIFPMGFPWMLAQTAGCLFIALRFLSLRGRSPGVTSSSAAGSLAAAGTYATGGTTE